MTCSQVLQQQDHSGLVLCLEALYFLLMQACAVQALKRGACLTSGHHTFAMQHGMALPMQQPVSSCQTNTCPTSPCLVWDSHAECISHTGHPRETIMLCQGQTTPESSRAATQHRNPLVYSIWMGCSLQMGIQFCIPLARWCGRPRRTAPCQPSRWSCRCPPACCCS